MKFEQFGMDIKYIHEYHFKRPLFHAHDNFAQRIPNNAFV